MPRQDLTEFDKRLGALIRSYRQLRGLSQTALGNHIGLTFQQIQKYEQGLNRVSTRTLNELRQILDIPFKEIFPEGDALTDTLIADNIDLKIIKKFCEIESPKTKRAILKLMAAMSE
jgi:transcriptional regulator with XRE-family HTH domain